MRRKIFMLSDLQSGGEEIEIVDAASYDVLADDYHKLEGALRFALTAGIITDDGGPLHYVRGSSKLAIDDWLHLYAPELCDADDVARSTSRVNAEGTIAYIADVQQQNRAALAPKEPT